MIGRRCGLHPEQPDLQRGALRRRRRISGRVPEGRGGRLFLEVADRGKGVAPGAGEQVFQRLVTLEDSRSSGEGSGLGLSIARELARRMGGDIDLESVPGLRTVFTVRLPKWQDERDS